MLLCICISNVRIFHLRTKQWKKTIENDHIKWNIKNIVLHHAVNHQNCIYCCYFSNEMCEICCFFVVSLCVRKKWTEIFMQSIKLEEIKLRKRTTTFIFGQKKWFIIKLFAYKLPNWTHRRRRRKKNLKWYELQKKK